MKKFIVLFICILVFLTIIYLFNNFLDIRYEPFVNPVVVSNVDKRPDEVFLLATNPETFKINGNPDTFNYTTGTTYSDALAACQAVGPGVTLANLSTVAASPSKLSLNVAIDLSANWCAAGWVVESATTRLAYFPMTNFTKYKCKLNNTTNASTVDTPALNKFFLPETSAYGPPVSGNKTYKYGLYNPGTNGKAFAICVGPKPPLPTAKINPFNDTTYSMYNTELMTYLRTGDSETDPYNNDIFPVSFTDAQIFTELQNTTPPFDIKKTRENLINKYKLDTNSSTSNTLNLGIKNLEDSTLTSSWTTNSQTQSCTALSAIYTQMDTSLTTLATLFSDLSGTVLNMIKAKEENAVLQTTIREICVGPQASSAPISAACSRLLSLDYDILYRNKSLDEYTQTNTITDLESLNYALRIRECEIQQALGSLEEILTNLSCGASTLTRLRGKYKNNRIVRSPAIPATSTTSATPEIIVPIDCNTYFDKDGNFSANETTFSAPNSAFKIGRDIQYNPVERLKVSLQQISPFFSGAQYSSLLSDVLNQLSVTLRKIPQDYSDMVKVGNNTNNNMGIIESLFASP
jgi:hypothetical protein